MRAFIAIDISEEVRTALGRVAESLSSQTKKEVRWVAPENLHLTLKFLGKMDAEKQQKSVEKVLEKSVKGASPLVLTCKGLGAFPHWKKIRILWAGLEGETESLIQYCERLEEVLEPLGFERELGKISPHITLGRVRFYSRKSLWPNTLQLMPVQKYGDIRVDHVTLYKSELTKEGAIYRALRRIPFSNH